MHAPILSVLMPLSLLLLMAPSVITLVAPRTSDRVATRLAKLSEGARLAILAAVIVAFALLLIAPAT